MYYISIASFWLEKSSGSSVAFSNKIIVARFSIRAYLK